MNLPQKSLKTCILLLLVSAVATLSLNGCSELTSKKGDSYKYRIPWSNGNGKISFQDVEIDDLENPFVMKGASAKIIASGDYNVMSGPSGEVAEPNFLKSGNTLIPTDTLSVSTVSAYAHMNRIKKIDKKLGILDLLKWPRVLGVNTMHEDKPGYYSVNNAFYSPNNDTINILPYIHNGLPLSLNGNTIAHEHFHSVFHSQVEWVKLHSNSEVRGIHLGAFQLCEDLEFYQDIVKKLNSGPESASGSIASGEIASKDEPQSPKNILNQEKLIQQANYVISRGWDEGSADVYSYLYDKNEKFLEDSFPGGHYYRNLSGHYQAALRRKVEVVSQLKRLNDTRCKVAEGKDSEIKKTSQVPMRFENEASYFYQLGSDFAKFLKRLSDSTVMQEKYGKESFQKIVVAMIKVLPKVDEYLKANYHKTMLSPLQFIKYILQFLEIESDPEVCQMIQQLYGSDYCGFSVVEQEGV